MKKYIGVVSHLFNHFWGILHQVSPIYFLCGYVENMDSEVTNTNYEPILMIGIENIQDSISHV